MDLDGRRISRRERLITFLKTEVREDLLLEIELLILAFATGVGDSTTYSEYRVFTANHTGNTILLAVSTGETTSGNPPVNGIPIPIVLIAISLSMFILGGWVTGQLGNYFGRRQRWWLLLNNFFQMLLVLLAAVVQIGSVGWSAGPRTKSIDTGPASRTVIAALALSAGSQVSLARSLHMTEITTANATSCYIDLLIDKRLFHSGNRARNRRLSFLACLSAGSFVGAFAYQHFGSAKTLTMSMLGKVVVTIMMFYNKGGLWIPGAFAKNAGCYLSDEGSDAGMASDASRIGVEKECKCRNGGEPGPQDATVLSVKPKFDEFDYRGTQTPTLLNSRSDSREAYSNYTMGNIFDLNDMHVHLQIPSWNITAGRYRHMSGV